MIKKLKNNLSILQFLFRFIFLFCLTFGKPVFVNDFNKDEYFFSEISNIYDPERIGRHNLVENVFPEDYIHDPELRKKEEERIKELNRQTKEKIRRRMNRRKLSWKKFFFIIFFFSFILSSPFLFILLLIYWYYTGFLFVILPKVLYILDILWPYYCIYGWWKLIWPIFPSIIYPLLSILVYKLLKIFKMVFNFLYFFYKIIKYILDKIYTLSKFFFKFILIINNNILFFLTSIIGLNIKLLKFIINLFQIIKNFLIFKLFFIYCYYCYLIFFIFVYIYNPLVNFLIIFLHVDYIKKILFPYYNPILNSFLLMKDLWIRYFKKKKKIIFLKIKRRRRRSIVFINSFLNRLVSWYKFWKKRDGKTIHIILLFKKKKNFFIFKYYYLLKNYFFIYLMVLKFRKILLNLCYFFIVVNKIINYILIKDKEYFNIYSNIKKKKTIFINSIKIEYNILKEEIINFIEEFNLARDTDLKFYMFLILFISIIMPLPVTYSLWYIIVKFTIYLNIMIPHKAGVYILNFSLIIMHLLMSYTYFWVSFLSRIDYKKILLKQFDSFWEYWNYWIILLNFLIVFFFLTIIIFYITQGINYTLANIDNIWVKHYSMELSSYNGWPWTKKLLNIEKQDNFNCLLCYIFWRFFYVSFWMCFILFVLFFRMLSDDQVFASLYRLQTYFKESIFPITGTYGKIYHEYWNDNLKIFYYLDLLIKDSYISNINNWKREIEDIPFNENFVLNISEQYSIFTEFDTFSQDEKNKFFSVIFINEIKKIKEDEISKKDKNLILANLFKYELLAELELYQRFHKDILPFNKINDIDDYNYDFMEVRKVPEPFPNFDFRFRTYYQLAAWERIFGFMLGVIISFFVAFIFCNIFTNNVFVIDSRVLTIK